MQGIKDRVAIVTGGATSIGAEIVRTFVEAGARVAIADVAETEGQRLVEELRPNAIFARTDLVSDDDIAACVERTNALLGRIDFVVNAAGIYKDKGPETTREEWLETLNVNVVGGAIISQMARASLRKTKGVIVNLGSISAKVSQKDRWSYPASKAAIHQLTRSQALDFAEDGIRVNTVSPGWTWSGIMEKVVGNNRQVVDNAAAVYHLIERTADRREIANAVLFLCSDYASFITGADIPVDGGYSSMGPERRDAGRPPASR
jgi:NAD(P)-dependent dehydrogenase (short-subunit alcohol dehydrogenase family)